MTQDGEYWRPCRSWRNSASRRDPGSYPGVTGDVRSGPDGKLYLLTDSANGRLLRIDPAG